MNDPGSTCTAVCRQAAPLWRPISEEGVCALFVAFSASLVLGALGARVSGLVAPDVGSQGNVTAVVSLEDDARRDLFEELGRSFPDPSRVLMLLEASGMTIEEGRGALRLARRAAAAARDWEKAYRLGETTAHLEARARPR